MTRLWTIECSIDDRYDSKGNLVKENEISAATIALYSTVLRCICPVQCHPQPRSPSESDDGMSASSVGDAAEHCRAKTFQKRSHKPGLRAASTDFTVKSGARCRRTECAIHPHLASPELWRMSGTGLRGKCKERRKGKPLAPVIVLRQSICNSVWF